MKKNLQLLTLFFFLSLTGMSLISADCNPDVDPGLGPNEMKASSNVEGLFFANDAFAASATSYIVNATMPYTPISGEIRITLNIPKNASVPYTVNVATSEAVINYCLESSNVCTTFKANKSSGSGSITVTSLTPYLEGTFSGTVIQDGGAQSRVISGGEFKAGF